MAGILIKDPERIAKINGGGYAGLNVPDGGSVQIAPIEGRPGWFEGKAFDQKGNKIGSDTSHTQVQSEHVIDMLGLSGKVTPSEEMKEQLSRHQVNVPEGGHITVVRSERLKGRFNVQAFDKDGKAVGGETTLALEHLEAITEKNSPAVTTQIAGPVLAQAIPLNTLEGKDNTVSLRTASGPDDAVPLREVGDQKSPTGSDVSAKNEEGKTPLAGTGKPKDGKGEENGLMDMLGNNKGGIGGLLMGLLIGMMTGDPMIGMLAALIGGGLGAAAVDGKDGMLGGLFGGGKGNHQTESARTASAVKAKDLEKLGPEETKSVELAGKMRDGQRWETEKDASVSLNINNKGQVESVAYTKDGIKGPDVPLAMPVQLLRNKSGDYVVGDGYNVNSNINKSIVEARDQQQRSTPDAQAKVQELGAAYNQAGIASGGQDVRQTGQQSVQAVSVAKPAQEALASR